MTKKSESVQKAHATDGIRTPREVTWRENTEVKNTKGMNLLITYPVALANKVSMHMQTGRDNFLENPIFVSFHNLMEWSWGSPTFCTAVRREGGFEFELGERGAPVR